MINSIKKPALWITLAALLISIAFAGCGSTASTSTSSASGQKSSSSTQQSTIQPTQQQAGTSGQKQDNSNLTAILNRAAEILGISSTKFTTAFQNTMPTQSGQQGQLPAGSANMTPPSGGTPPSGQQGQPPAMDFSSTTMQSVFTKMATELSISADKIQAALVQAQKELANK